MSDIADASTVVAPARARRMTIHGLGLYVLVMYGITYYAVTTAAPLMAKELGLPTSFVFAVITASLLLSAALAPRLGRITDRVGAASILLVGAILRALSLAALAIAPEAWTFAAALLVVQVLGLATEYDATFAVAVELEDEKARTAMSQVTLWGGLASTAFWPATAVLLERMSWRSTFMIYAGVTLIICVPIALAIRAAPRAARPVADRADPAAGSAPIGTAEARDVRSPPFWLVAAAFALGGLVYNLPSLMLPVLEGLGLGATAIVVGMLFGPAQTAGRFCDMVVGDRVSPVIVAAVATATSLAALAILLLGDVTSALLFAVLFGAGAGVGYVARGSVVLSLYGADNYAARLGRLGTVRLVVTALSPLLLSLILEHLGARPVIYACCGAVIASLVCFVALARHRSPARA